MRPLLIRPRWNDPYTIEAQQVLAELGYYQGMIDGDFGPLTDEAVRAFQRDRGLRLVDGKVGEETWGALDAAALELAIVVTEQPIDNGTHLRFAVWPSLDPGPQRGMVSYAVENAGTEVVHGWRDRIRLGPVDGEPFMDVVLPWSDVLAVGGRTDTLGVFFAEAQSLPDGWYDLAVTLNLDGRGDGGTLRFQVRSNAVVEWTFPYELITR